MRKSSIIGNTLLLYAVLLFAACKNTRQSIPFPEKMELPQPVTTPIKFTTPITLTWPNSKQVKAQVRELNFDRLPSRPFDSSGFKPFSKMPKVISFDWKSLPTKSFNYDALPSKPLSFETILLSPPQMMETSLRLKKKSPDLIYEMGGPLMNRSIDYVFEDKDGFLWIAGNRGVFRYDGQSLSLYMPAWVVQTFRSMIQDRKGQIWMATDRGIYILNTSGGILKHLSVKNGLASDDVFAMMPGSDGRMWVAAGSDSASGGINIIDENLGTIKHFGVKEGLSNYFSVDVMQDTQNNIWVSTLFGGANILDLKAGRLKYLGKQSGLSSDSVASVMQDRSNRIWVADVSGKLNVIDVHKNSITQYNADQGMKRTTVWQLREDQWGNIWVGTIGAFTTEPAGVEIINEQKKIFKHLTATAGLNNNNITSIVPDKRGQIWIGTPRGLNMLYKNGHAIEHWETADVSSMAEDDHGLIWIGTSQGVEIHDSATRLTKILNRAGGLLNDTMQSVRNVNGEMWICDNGGFEIIDRARKSIQHWSKQQGLSFKFVTNFIKDQHRNLWIVSAFNNEKGIDVVNERNGTIQHLGVGQGLKDSSISDIIRDRENNILFISYKGTLAVIDSGQKTIRYLEQIPPFKDDYYKLLLEDKKGQVWIATRKGIVVMNARRDSSTHLSEAEGLIDNRVTSLNEYNGRVYAATQAGVTIVTPPDVSSSKKWEFKSLGRDDGITKDLAGNFATDAMTRTGKFLWGDKGITVLNTVNGFEPMPVTVVSRVDVFNHTLRFSRKPWSFVGQKDTIWEKGKDTFYLSGQLPSHILFPNEGKIDFDSVSGFFSMPVNLSLPHNQNYLQFHFTQVHGDNPDTTWYRYVLEGVDKEWSDRTYIPASENYRNLSPGDYTFKVASLFKQKWTTPAEFSFTIRPPWWKTWWAYTLFALVFIAVIVRAVQYRSHKLHEENLALEEKINQRTAELKQSLQDLKATQAQLIQSEKMASLGELTAGIAHEIQNPLNFVNNFSDVNKELLLEMKDEIAEGNLEIATTIANDVIANEEKINHHGKRADAIVKGMLQHSRASTGQKEPTDINALADEYLRLAYHGLRAKDKSFNAKFETHFDNTIGKINIIPQDIGRVLLNLINNAFYAVDEKKRQLDGTYEPIVAVRTRKFNGQVEIAVKDNGGGIPQKVLDKIFQPFFTTKPTGQGTGLGLSLSYDIVKAHGGELNVETEESKGSVFIILLPNQTTW